MTIDEVIKALLGKYVDKYGAVLLDKDIKDLPGDIMGQIYQDIKKHAPDIDLSELLDNAESTQQPRYTLRDASYYLSDRPKVEYIVENIVAEGSVNLWYGQWGSKKTWSAIDLGVCVAMGKDWLGMQVKQNTVLIIDEESGDSRLADRIKLTMKGESADANTPIKSVSLAQFNLLKQPSDAIYLLDLIKQVGAKMVIIDALADIMLGGDENSVKDTQPVFACLRKIAEVSGASMIVIHHANKLGGYRGSSAIAGAIDTMVKIESKQDSDVITFNTEKMRDGKPANFAGLANWTDTGFYITESEQATKTLLTLAQQYTFDYFANNGDASFDDLVNYAKGSYAEQTLRKTIQYLTSNKLLSRKDDGGQRVKATYGVSKKVIGN